jgi:hypothetical protein
LGNIKKRDLFPSAGFQKKILALDASRLEPPPYQAASEQIWAATGSRQAIITWRRLVITSQGFQTVDLAARPERRNNHSQHFSLWGLGRRVKRLGSRFHRTIVPSNANFHAKYKE